MKGHCVRIANRNEREVKNTLCVFAPSRFQISNPPEREFKHTSFCRYGHILYMSEYRRLVVKTQRRGGAK